MNVNLAVALAEYEVERFPSLHAAGWAVIVNPRPRRRLALCDYQRKAIVLSESFVRLNDAPKVRETTLHEIAHALTPGAGHGPAWKAQARALGVPPTRCDFIAVMPQGKYVATCQGCGQHYHRYRRPTRQRYCRYCPQIGPLAFMTREKT